MKKIFLIVLFVLITTLSFYYLILLDTRPKRTNLAEMEYIIDNNKSSEEKEDKRYIEIISDRVLYPEKFDNSTFKTIYTSRMIDVNKDTIRYIRVSTTQNMYGSPARWYIKDSYPGYFIIENKDVINEILKDLDNLKFRKIEKTDQELMNNQYMLIGVDEKIRNLYTYFVITDNGIIKLEDGGSNLLLYEVPCIGIAVEPLSIQNIIEEYFNSTIFEGKNLKEWNFGKVTYNDDCFYKCEYNIDDPRYGEIRYFDSNGKEVTSD